MFLAYLDRMPTPHTEAELQTALGMAAALKCPNRSAALVLRETWWSLYMRWGVRGVITLCKGETEEPHPDTWREACDHAEQRLTQNRLAQ